MAESSAGQDWTDTQNDLIVADYFAMRELELIGQRYNKSERRRNLKQHVNKAEGAIEFKHQNISAILERLGMFWIPGYKPKHNFQNSLIDAIERYLAADSTTFELAAAQENELHEETEIYLEVAPKIDLQPPKENKHIERLIQKFDPAERDARNRQLGKLGEQAAFAMERRNLINHGREDLATKVRWVSQEDGDGAGYDIHSYTSEGTDRLIEVKTTNGHRTTPFYISENERNFSEEQPERFKLLRLYEFSSAPRAFELQPPLSNFVSLNPTNYRAQFT